MRRKEILAEMYTPSLTKAISYALMFFPSESEPILYLTEKDREKLEKELDIKITDECLDLVVEDYYGEFSLLADNEHIIYLKTEGSK